MKNVDLSVYCDILSIHTSCFTMKDVKKAYRRCVLKYHPDTDPNNDILNKKFAQIVKAYNFLKQYCQSNNDIITSFSNDFDYNQKNSFNDYSFNSYTDNLNNNSNFNTKSGHKYDSDFSFNSKSNSKYERDFNSNTKSNSKVETQTDFNTKSSDNSHIFQSNSKLNNSNNSNIPNKKKRIKLDDIKNERSCSADKKLYDKNQSNKDENSLFDNFYSFKNNNKNSNKTKNDFIEDKNDYLEEKNNTKESVHNHKPIPPKRKKITLEDINYSKYVYKNKLLDYRKKYYDTLKENINNKKLKCKLIIKSDGYEINLSDIIIRLHYSTNDNVKLYCIRQLEKSEAKLAMWSLLKALHSDTISFYLKKEVIRAIKNKSNKFIKRFIFDCREKLNLLLRFPKNLSLDREKSFSAQS